jgi:hypothetical protein
VTYNSPHRPCSRPPKVNPLHTLYIHGLSSAWFSSVISDLEDFNLVISIAFFGAAFSTRFWYSRCKAFNSNSDLVDVCHDGFVPEQE